MKRRQKAYQYKFTKRKHSLRGIIAFLLALASIAGGAAMVASSFLNQGKGSVYLGSGGILALILAILAFILGILSMREEDSYKIFPALGTGLGAAASAVWILVYAAGF